MRLLAGKQGFLRLTAVASSALMVTLIATEGLGQAHERVVRNSQVKAPVVGDRGLPTPPPAGKGPVVQTGKVTHVADGDTLDVDIYGDGTSRPKRVRVTGINTMELTTYARDSSRLRGECHGVEATKRARQLLLGKEVRLTAREMSSKSGERLRRAVAFQDGGQWRDFGSIMLDEGHANWLSNGTEYTWNQYYAALAKRSASRGIGIWNTSACGAGPSAGARLKVRVNWDAPGNDRANKNGEYFAITNEGSASVSLGGWWVRDGVPYRRFTFPARTSLAPGQTLYVHVGSGTNSGNRFYWGQSGSVFDNANGAPKHEGDGGYLFDPQGDLRAWHQYS